MFPGEGYSLSKYEFLCWLYTLINQIHFMEHTGFRVDRLEDCSRKF